MLLLIISSSMIIMSIMISSDVYTYILRPFLTARRNEMVVILPLAARMPQPVLPYHLD